MMRPLHLITCLWASAVASLPTSNHHLNSPTAHTKNGTYVGTHSREYDQDFFLGVPYAQPPIGDARFRNPLSLNDSWYGSRRAAQYSPACVGYGPSQMGYNISEDCLYLNIIRPSGHSAHSELPVVVWIHGGGWVQGSGVDLRYNMSFIVEQSQAMGQPMMAVTLNYRLSAFGFLQGYEKDPASGSNWGIRDQRLALQWIRENVDAFGGQSQRANENNTLTWL
jgi:carboxylesterase type B